MGHAQVVGINEVVEVGHFNKDVNGVVERKAFNKEKKKKELIKKKQGWNTPKGMWNTFKRWNTAPNVEHVKKKGSGTLPKEKITNKQGKNRWWVVLNFDFERVFALFGIHLLG